MSSLKRLPLLLVVINYHLQVAHGSSSQCVAPETIGYSIRQEYCDQPIFNVFLPKTEENQMLDNICATFFPLPDDPNTFTLHVASVYCDESYDVQSYIGADVIPGQAIVANTLNTFRDFAVGYAGCDTNIIYRCNEFGVEVPSFVFGVSPQCKPIGLSCLRKIQEIIKEQGLPEVDYHILPMKLPNRCVTQQLCTQPANPFYNNLHSVAMY
ncbi:uncharacterized protein LOC128988333 isoform X1 [Macrosteles quadrilineatus]|uniref:uncharacterized protein LOC128988333 isoform X1 n=1 Tax=Macrosteles quadrilineatus TaxID=74068 RepID=UPI0023E1569B|nr:uncharacterized protein LOC128988333 isoform X1 [Macrosteles quadrilineatus]